jgi:hypothetical protein
MNARRPAAKNYGSKNNFVPKKSAAKIGAVDKMLALNQRLDSTVRLRLIRAGFARTTNMAGWGGHTLIRP